MPLPELDPPKKEKSFWEKVTSKKEPADPPPPPAPKATAPAAKASATKSTLEILKGRGRQIDEAVDGAQGVNKGELGKKWDETFKL